MVLEKEILPFYDWLFLTLQGPGALLLFLVIVAGLTVASLFLAYLRCAILYGPQEGFYAVAKSLASAIGDDLPRLSLGRTWAIARLAVQEALRRWVLVVFVVFALILFFAGWFLDRESDHPVRLYLSIVLTGTEFLILILAAILCTFSIPNDVKYKTIYTVVTKPVRAGEIVLGRIIGFCLINTAILIMMGVVSYGFVVRGLSHRHTISAEAAEKVAATGQDGGGWRGRTSYDAFHRHPFTVGADGQGLTEYTMDHRHAVRTVGAGDQAEFELGPPLDALTAKVPIYGKLRFIDRAGREGKGISVGKEWTYRQYIEGGSLAAAVWTFQGLAAQDYPDGLPLEMNLSVFRTYKADIVTPIGGKIRVKNPSTGLTSEPRPFDAQEYVVSSVLVPRQLKALGKDGTLSDADLFGQFLDESGKIEVWIECADRSQYFGMAQPDVYVRGRDRSFVLNFAKGYLGIWLQMVIVTSFGVALSTFLSGPVALFATLIVYLVGLFKDFLMGVATGTEPGGGPAEAALRLLTQKNIITDLDVNPVVDRVIPGFDTVMKPLIWIVARILPDFSHFNTSAYVAYGYNISANLMAQHCLVTLVFVLVLTVYGYFFLKSREIAA
jgi:hypothetical protein